MKIPVIINNRNLLNWTKSMVEKIKTFYHPNAADVIANSIIEIART